MAYFKNRGAALHTLLVRANPRREEDTNLPVRTKTGRVWRSVAISQEPLELETTSSN